MAATYYQKYVDTSDVCRHIHQNNSFCCGQRINESSSRLFLFICFRFFEYIYLYQSMVMFQIDQKTKDCSKIALTEAWDPFDIPDNSTFEDQYFIGGPGDNVEIQEWSDRKPARQRKSAPF